MEVKTYQQDDITVFAISGEINITTSPDLKKMFEKQLAKKLLVDLEKVTYVDSSGLATLVEILKKTRATGGQLGLSGMTDKVKSLFEITKLDKLFRIFRNQQEALAAINQK
jgi:anti-sigma B factor antagonist